MTDSTADHPWDAATLNRVRDEAGLAEVEFHPQIGSTNDRALERLRRRDWLSPCLVLTETQTAGRGRGANRWWSATGGLTFSLLMEPAADTLHAALPVATLRAGLAIAQTIEHLSQPSPSDRPIGADRVGLKWPNDVHLSGRKVAGLLLEQVADRPGLVVGVGLNVNQRFDDAPHDVRNLGTSLYEVDGATRDRAAVLIAAARLLISELSTTDVPLRQTATGLVESSRSQSGVASERWVDRFRRRCVLTGRLIQIETLGSVRSGRCLGIDDSGRLMLETETGPIALVSGSVVKILS